MNLYISDFHFRHSNVINFDKRLLADTTEMDDTYHFMKNKEKALNAAACINNYSSSSVYELIRNNQRFKN